MGAELSAGPLKDAAYIGGTPVAVICQAVHHERDAAGTVALVDYLLVVLATKLASALFDCLCNGVLGHVGGLGIVNGVAKGEILIGIAAAHFGSHDYPPGQLAPYPPSPGVGAGLRTLDFRPMGMS